MTLNSTNTRRLVKVDWEKEHKKRLFDKKIERIDERIMIDEEIGYKLTGEWDSWEILHKDSSAKHLKLKGHLANAKIISENGESVGLEDAWVKLTVRLKLAKDLNQLQLLDSEWFWVDGTSYTSNNPFLSGLLTSFTGQYLNKKKNRFAKVVQQIESIEIKENTNITLDHWDTVYATSYQQLNEIISKENLFPSLIQQTYSSEDEDDPWGDTWKYDFDLSFHDWQATLKGESAYLDFKVMLDQSSNITITKNDKPVSFEVTDSDTYYIRTQFKLDRVTDEQNSAQDPTGENNGQYFKLVPPTQQKEDVDPVISVPSTKLPEDIPQKQLAIVNSYIQKWFVENLDQMLQVFSYFQLNQTASDETFQWLKPTYTSYAVSIPEKYSGENEPDEGTPEYEEAMKKSTFACLNMVNNHDPGNNKAFVDSLILEAANIDDDHPSVVALDYPIFAQNWLKQAVYKMQIGTNEQFDEISSGHGFQNNVEIPFATLSDDGWEGAQAKISANNFTVKIDEDTNLIVMDIRDMVFEKDGIEGHVNYNQRFEFTTKSKESDPNKKVFVPIESGEVAYTFDFNIEQWRRDKDMLINILAGIAIGVAAGIAGGALGSFVASKLVGTAFWEFLGRLGSSAADAAAEEGGLMAGIESGAVSEAAGEVASVAGSELGEEAIELTTTTLFSEVEQEVGNTGGNMRLINNGASAIYNITTEPLPLMQRLVNPAFKLIGGSILGGVGGSIPVVVNDIIELVQEDNFESLPEINEFVLTTLGAIQWPDDSEFVLDHIKMQGAMLMCGNLK